MMTTAAANQRCPCSPQATYEKKVSRFWGGLSEELSAEFGNLYVTEFGSMHVTEFGMIYVTEFGSIYVTEFGMI